jgi:dCMP deaminase
MEHKKVAIAYIPVLHQGYLTYIKSLERVGVTELYLVSDDMLMSHEELDYINRKDRLRALPSGVMQTLLANVTTMCIAELTIATVMQLHEEKVHIYAPREDINELMVQTYFGGHAVTYENVFLRWNKDNVGEEDLPQGDSIPLSAFEKEIFAQVVAESEKSADWWRQVGAALVQEGRVLTIAHNEHMPDEEFPNIFGDTRSLFKKGVNINYVTTAHAEAATIAGAAKQGMSTDGATLFTTDFPCPYCARVIAKSGIKKIFYLKGYAVLGGDEFFKEVGIEVVKVEV